MTCKKCGGSGEVSGPDACLKCTRAAEVNYQIEIAEDGMMADKTIKRITKLFESNTLPVLTINEIAAKCKMSTETATKFIKAYKLKRSPAWLKQTAARAEAGRLRSMSTRRENGRKRYTPMIKKAEEGDFPPGTNFAAPGRHFHSLDVSDDEFYKRLKVM